MNYRNANMVWLTAEDYQFVPQFEIFDTYKDPTLKLYTSAILGIFNKYYHAQNFIDFFNALHLNRPQDIRKIFELIILDNCKDKLLEERPGMIDLERAYFNQKRSLFMTKDQDTISFKLDQRYVWNYFKKDLPTSKPIRDIVKMIQSNRSNETYQLIDVCEKILTQYFHIERKTLRSSKIKELKAESKKELPKKFLTLHTMKKNSQRSFIEKIHSQEFTDNYILEELKENQSSDTSSKDRHQKTSRQQIIKSIFGEPAISLPTIEAMERSCCVGIHQGEKIHMTKGIYDNQLSTSFYKNQMEEMKVENKNHFEKNRLIYRRAIHKLKELIQHEILRDQEESVVLRTSGKIVPPLAWRYKVMQDSRIFKKQYPNEMGKISVHILLDQSASQKEQQSLVSAQAYCITQALTQLSIPTRVIGFCNLYQYQILRIYRDLHDPISYNEKIFEYTPSSANRDGLAIKIMRYLIEKDQQEKNLLIILSDGKPNDTVNAPFVGRSKIPVQPYQDQKAIEDTSKEVFLTRNDGILLLGVFTGKKKDLTQIKRIYGQDFCHIPKVERFSDVVGHYLKQIIKNREI